MSTTIITSGKLSAYRRHIVCEINVKDMSEKWDKIVGFTIARFVILLLTRARMNKESQIQGMLVLIMLLIIRGVASNSNYAIVSKNWKS